MWKLQFFNQTTNEGRGSIKLDEKVYITGHSENAQPWDEKETVNEDCELINKNK